MPSRRSLEIWRLVINNLTADDMSLNPWAGCEGYAECEWALELNDHWYCLNVGMEGIGILVIECCPKFNMSILLQKFQFLLVPPFGWLTSLLMKRLLGVMAISLQE
ncbi:uncharacterized protein LOC126714324 [Quercus robur]|uniref:uncharacterized protein LOC126714324 n=1 Tax=Quercus robur TaxID=38942 RepID=UPI0021638BA2|nr:uncharacterized protein LOC126714324 [Quercus robur]